MKATVYYIHLTNEQVDELNEHPDDWGSPIGKAYLSAKDGIINATNFNLVVKAATIDGTDAEQIWMALQNMNEYSWADDRKGCEAHNGMRRSMDVGDIIVWENGKRETVAALGFTTITEGS